MRSGAGAMVFVGAAVMLASCGGGGSGGGGAPAAPGGPPLGFQIEQKAYLKSSNSELFDNFGWAVALDGDTLAVSALGEDSISGMEGDNGGSNVGAVYVFVRSGGTWAQQAYIKPSNPDSGDQFGASLALSGDTLVVGAPAEASANGNPADDSGAFNGAVYVFVRSGGNWTEQAYLKASNIGSTDEFGFSVAIDGDTLAVGAPGEDSDTTGVNSTPNDFGGNNGAAYVFVRTGNAWSEEAYVKASNSGATYQFGYSVALSGNTLAVGSPSEDSATIGVNNPPSGLSNRSGAAYVFTRSGTTWSQEAYVKASNTDPDDEFGWSIALSGDTLAVGARSEGPAPKGAAYVFTRSGTTWSQQALLRASNAEDNDAFGAGIALDGDLLAVAAPGEGSMATGVGGDQSDNNAPNSGAAYVFQRSGSAWSQQNYVKASNSAMSDRFGGALALSGTTLAVGAIGEDSIATGVNGDQSDDPVNTVNNDSGATYILTP